MHIQNHASNCNFFEWVEEDGKEESSNAEDVNMLKQEVLLINEAMVEMNKSLVEDMRTMKELLAKNSDILSDQMQFLKGCVIVMVLILGMVIVKLL